MTSDYDRIRQDNITEYGQGTRHLDFLQRLYADRTHFIFELLQNAEDARATQVTFVLDRTRLEVYHDGRPFEERDVRGICGVSESTKDDELTAIGKFGIGFKSVYAYTTAPEVHAGEEHFRIRHYVRPEAAPWLGEPLREQTVFIFPFDREDVSPDLAHDEISAGLRELNPIALLFLERIESVMVRSEAGTVRLSRARDDADPRSVELIRTNNDRVVLHQYWWAFRRPLDHIGHSGQRVEIAFKRSGSDALAPVERLPSSPLVAYFPTDKESRLGFLLQAPLRTTPARDNVPEHDPDNIALIHEAAALLVDALEQLRDTGHLGLDVFEALPIDSEAFGEGAVLRPLFDAVREALRTRPLVPTADSAGYALGSVVRLARGGGIRELLSVAQLGALAGAPGPMYWQSEQLTRERRRGLWDYLRQDIGIEEVTPEWVAGRLDAEFLAGVDDAWLIQLYAMLEQNPALWRAARNTWERPGPARAMPLIRLEDGTHVAPFNVDGRPNAYLPGPAPSEYPTVRRSVAVDRGARSFLDALGLQEPDAVDEVLEQILPRYRSAADVAEEQHARDLAVIMRGLRTAAGQRRAGLVKQLRVAAFLLARPASQEDYVHRAPVDCYWPDDELEHYFAFSPDAWFLHERYAELRRELTELGVADQVRVSSRPTDAMGHVVLRDSHGDHSRGLHGFDPDLHIAGMDAALAHPDLRRSAYVWNRLLVPRANLLRGTVERASRLDYVNAERREQDTDALRLAATRIWLPAAEGRYAAPRELAIDDLPPNFVRHRGMADALGMITSVVQQASAELGIPLYLLRFLADNPSVLAELNRTAEGARTQTTPSGILPTQLATDLPAQLRDAFTKPVQFTHDSVDDDAVRHGGHVGVPTFRRERTAAAIAEAQAVEPYPNDRFRLLPRKVWDGKDPTVRQFLLEQYAGRCQICDATFAKRDGNPYFEVQYLVSYTGAAWIDRPGSVLCLCPTCASKLLHGQVGSDDVLGQIRSWRTRAEGGIAAKLHVTLCGDPTAISYTEKHLLDLQVMLAVAISTAKLS